MTKWKKSTLEKRNYFGMTPCRLNKDLVLSSLLFVHCSSLKHTARKKKKRAILELFLNKPVTITDKQTKNNFRRKRNNKIYC
jgi:hypothetical protein